MSQTQPPLKRAAFVIGTPRAGTTLLRVMLAGHPKLFCPPEMVIAPHETMAQRAEHMQRRYWEKGGLRRALMFLENLSVDEAKAAVAALGDKTIPEVYAYLQERCGDRLLVDKCPHLGAHPGALERLETWFPDVRYILITRHPGAVIRSLQNMPMAEVMLQGYDGGAEAVWREANKIYLDFLARIPAERWTKLRYEDLVRDPQPELERVCATLGVDFDEAVLEPYEGDRMREGPKGARAIGDPNLAGRGKIDPSLADKWLRGFDPRRVTAETRALAKDLGYDLGAMALPPIAAASDAIGALFDTARELEQSIELPMDIDAAEGRRFLLRMLSASVDTFVEEANVDRPSFHHAESPTRKMFADNPDTDYLRAPIRLGPGRVYRLWGFLPAETLYAGILLYGKGGRIGNRLTDQQLDVDDDGNFELRISTEAQPGVWLQGDGDETAVLVRQYYSSRAKQPPLRVNIELESPETEPRPLDAAELAGALRRSQRMLSAIFKRTYGAYQMASKMALNTFIEIPAEQLFPTPDNKYRACWYRFGYDQVMIVRGRLPKARYFGLSLCNAWLESLDYRRHQVVLNHEQIQTDDDGNFEVCLAHRDVGHPNWLDTTGHHAGYLIARFLLPDGDLPELTTQVMYEKELNL